MAQRRGLAAALLSAFFVLGLSGCGNVAYVANNLSAQSAASTQGLDAVDRGDLASGNLSAIHARYAGQPPDTLTLAQLALSCDVLLKYQELGRASDCLDHYTARLRSEPGGLADPKRAEILAGKRALLALMSGDAETARDLTVDSTSNGARYVFALASIKLGRPSVALTIADKFSVQYQPALVFYAASLYAGAGAFDKARVVLEDPERRLLRDYGLSPGSDIFGQTIGTAPFRLDVFDEFSFGWFKTVDYSPAANVYVEYLAAHTYLETGDPVEAQRRLDTLLNFPAIAGYREVYWRALFDRAELAIKADDRARAEMLLRQAIDTIETIRGSVATESGRLSIIADKQEPYTALIDILLQQGKAAEALEFVERAHSRALVDLLATRYSFAAGDPAHAGGNSLVAALDQQAGEVELAAATAPNAVKQRLAALVDAKRRLREAAPDIAELVTVAPVEISALQQRLSVDLAAIAFFEGATSWHVFTVQRDQVRVHDIPKDPVLGKITAFRGALLNYTSDDYRETGQALYDSLLAPALKDVHTKGLIIIPSGPLHYISFPALYDGSQFLVERFVIREMPSLALLSHTPRAGSDTGGLIIGNPLQGDPHLTLPGAEREARDLAAMAPKTLLILGHDATTTKFRAIAPGHDFIHFAGHGEFDFEHPLESSLLFSTPDNQIDRLTTRALYDLRIDARLVFLSACQTGLAKIATGDDMIGLERGFFFSGANTVIASLWSVDDASTAQLVHAFYSAWLAGTPPAEALQAAQRKIRQNFPHPYFWSPFMVTMVGNG